MILTPEQAFANEVFRSIYVCDNQCYIIGEDLARLLGFDYKKFMKDIEFFNLSVANDYIPNVTKPILIKSIKDLSRLKSLESKKPLNVNSYNEKRVLLDVVDMSQLQIYYMTEATMPLETVSINNKLRITSVVLFANNQDLQNKPWWKRIFC